MPQMFPMPFAFLLVMTMALFLLSVIRVYWHSLSSACSSASTEDIPSNLYFNQTW